MKRIFKHDDERSKFHAVRAVQDLPLDVPMMITIEPFKKKRSAGQNRFLWSALLNDFVVQGFFEGRQFSKDTWHYHLKATNLPEPGDEGYGDDVTENYVKWKELPNGEMMLSGSTTQLTDKGFSKYLEKCYVLGVDLGVRFSAR